MKKEKLYWRDPKDEEELCCPLSYWLDMARDERLSEITLYEAIPEKHSNYFWCRSEREVTEKDYCGRTCDDYAPKNGKSGMCRHRSNTLYIMSEEPITFNVYA